MRTVIVLIKLAWHARYCNNTKNEYDVAPIVFDNVSGGIVNYSRVARRLYWNNIENVSGEIVNKLAWHAHLWMNKKRTKNAVLLGKENNK